MGRLAAIMALLLLNGFFVAAEFSLVRSRRTRLEAMTRSGDRMAQFTLRALGNLSRLLSASQLGITLASLALGWVAESTLGVTIEGWLHALPLPIEQSVRLSIAAGIALSAATFMHVVFGELAPRAAALNHPEQFAKWLTPVLAAFAWLTTPFTFVLNRAAGLVLRLLGQKVEVAPEPVHSPEELRMLIEQSEVAGSIHPQNAQLIEGVFEFSEKNAREVMTPRTEVVGIPLDATLDETLAIVEESNFSRYPVFDGSLDNVVGLVLAKDLLRTLRRNPTGFTMGAIMRRVHVVPGSREVEDVLTDFKRLKEHMAVVLDEFGGTAGVVTMEDLLEEIVGEILDEYDEAQLPIAPSPAGEVLVPGLTHIADVNDRYGLSVPDTDYNTIGGFVFGALGRLPSVGDRVSVNGATFTVKTMDGRRIDTLALKLVDTRAANTPAHGS
jgi:CBS domain containing-hemolysin-like protein